MTNYLKKKKMHKLAKKLCGLVPALSQCTYKFYRGSEWLSFAPVYGDDDTFCELYVCSSYLIFEWYFYDAYSNSRKTKSTEFIGGQNFKDLILSL